MNKNFVFSSQELKQMATPLADQITEAVDNGRHGEAKQLAKQLETESAGNIYAFEEFVTALLSYIYKHHGDEDLQNALKYCAEFLIKPLHDNIENMGFREKVEAFAALFRSHTGRGLKIEEDKEKVTFILDPCGSGGRMVKEGYFEPPKNLGKVESAHAITFGRENFPSYCTHCAVLHHIMPIKWSGNPFPPIEVGSGPGNPCKWHFYKDPSAIPERYYEQVGEQKQ